MPSHSTQILKLHAGLLTGPCTRIKIDVHAAKTGDIATTPDSEQQYVIGEIRDEGDYRVFEMLPLNAA